MAVYVVNGDIHPLWGYYPLLPLLFVQMSLLGMSAGVLFSSLTTRYRDLLMVVNVLVSLWMYGSPVVYPLSVITPGPLKVLIKINPVTEMMELIRLIMLGEGEFEITYYIAGLGMTLVMFLLSAVVFNRVERTFADTV